MPMPSALEKVRTAFLPPKEGGKPCIADLACDPIAELEKLEQRRSQIEASTNRLLAALKAVPERERAAYRAFTAACATDDAEQIDVALNRWLSLAGQSEFSGREYNALLAQKNYGSVMTTFKAEFPGAKKVLLRVCELRLAAAKEHAATVLGEETQRLSPEGFTPDEIRDSTRVKRASGRVKNLEAIQRRIENEPLESVWKIFAPQLLK
jgi:hypothetical protein